MAAKFLRRRTWWVRFYDPRTGALMRGSLETHDEARAELLRERIELEAALLAPRFQAAEIPTAIRALVQGEKPVPTGTGHTHREPTVPAVVTGTPAPQTIPKPRANIETAIKAYLDFIRIENASHHVAGKLSMMRRFFGSEWINALTLHRRLDKPQRRFGEVHAPFFKGSFVDEITPAIVQGFMDHLDVSKKTKRHYREFFHHFFEFCMKFDFYQPTNWHNPNPIAALPSYVSRNRRIVFLTHEQVEEQLRVLEGFPKLQMAVAIMIHAGLRRAETMWLTPEAIISDFSYFSVVNRRDDEREVESSLKTGDRTVTILPPLKALLRKYCAGLRGKWLIPSSTGEQWDGDAFAKKLRIVNGRAGLKWTCLHYRHTYATQRAAQGWSLFRIAREMGNSVSVVEEYYAGFIRPDSEASAA